LRTKGILKTFDACLFCGNFPPGKVRRQREKCSRYEREWSICRESLLEGLRIPLSKFVFALKLFAFEVPVNRAQRALGISYTTAHRVCGLLRKAICHGTLNDAHLLKGEVEAYESSFGGKGEEREEEEQRGKILVFGILKRQRKVRVEILEDVSAESRLSATIKKVKRRSLIHTDRFRSSEGLVMYGVEHERVDHSQRFSNGRVSINGIEGFWSYAKERLLKYHGVGRENFGYSLKE